MLKALRQSWLQARTLSVLQTYFEQDLRYPLRTDDAKLLKQIVFSTLADRGTPFDAAARFYVQFASHWIERGHSLDDLKFGHILGRMFALRSRMRFMDEHIAAFKKLSL